MEIEYQKAVELITSKEKFHICLGLDRVKSILGLLGNPQNNLKVIHIAGTNGKGSVSAMLSQILTTSGYKTGLYTSPHIVDYVERIKINQKNISQIDFSNLIFSISKLSSENNIYLTEFELLTVCAYKYFSDKETDICIIETGLGGRLDATNVVDKNVLSIITSIGLDHTDRLGDSIEKIAFEKAGIIKKDCPVLVSTSNSGYETIVEVANSQKSLLIPEKQNVSLKYENGFNYALVDGEKYRFNLLGLWQKMNLSLVLSAIDYLVSIGYEISKSHIAKALEKVFWPCRLQFIEKYNLLIDGAHNPDGAKVLRESLDYYFPNCKRIWVYGSINTKDYKNVMNILFREDDTVCFYDFDYKNSVDVSELKRILPTGIHISQRDLKYLVCENKDSLIIIAGSFYMIGDILKSEDFFQNIAELDNIY